MIKFVQEIHLNMDKNKDMDIKREVDPSQYEIGVIIARFQVDELHVAHKLIIDTVQNNHKKVIIFLGVSKKEGNRDNPLDFATRYAMVQEYAPNAIILPLHDQRSDLKWSHELDYQIRVPFGEKSALIYGGRDSFIPHYQGNYNVAELVTDIYISGTMIRHEISRDPINSRDFRRGIIHQIYKQRPITWSTVDVCPFKKDGTILLGRKPNEDKFRFVGGFLDRTDASDEVAAARELSEETGGNLEIGGVDGMTYILSQQVDDWRYAGTEHGIMTRLFICEVQWGDPKASDDLAEVKWFNLKSFENEDFVKANLVPEHQSMMIDMITKVKKRKLINIQ